MKTSDSKLLAVYEVGAQITWAVVFLAAWLYCIVNYGFLLGFGLGWLPAAILATILSFLWPLVAGGLALVVVVVAAILLSDH